MALLEVVKTDPVCGKRQLVARGHLIIGVVIQDCHLEVLDLCKYFVGKCRTGLALAIQLVELRKKSLECLDRQKISHVLLKIHPVGVVLSDFKF